MLSAVLHLKHTPLGSAKSRSKSVSKHNFLGGRYIIRVGSLVFLFYNYFGCDHNRFFLSRKKYGRKKFIATKARITLLKCFDKARKGGKGSNNDFPTPDSLLAAQLQYRKKPKKGADGIPEPFPPPTTKEQIYNVADYAEIDLHAQKVKTTYHLYIIKVLQFHFRS
jgi:hypothetical protein